MDVVDAIFLSLIFIYQIRGPKGVRLYSVDASEPTKANWMRYVKSARSFDEQNMIATQYKRSIYYRTLRVGYLLIYSGEIYECLVYQWWSMASAIEGAPNLRGGGGTCCNAPFLLPII